MTISAKKYIAWVLLLVGTAVDYFFFAACIINGLPPNGTYFLWPLGATAVAVCAVLYLRFLYRIEPPAPPGAWRLTLVDLMAVTFFCALAFSIIKAAASENRFGVLGPLFGPLAALLFLGGLLGASLSGIYLVPRRFVYALLHALRSYGWIVVGMFVIMIFGSLIDGSASSLAGILEEVLGLSPQTRDAPLVWLIRSGVVALAASSFILAKTRETFRKEG